MINSINPINNTAMASSFSIYTQAQSAAKQIAQVVYLSLEKISGSTDEGISVKDLENIKSLIENASATKSSAYSLVNTLIDRFDALSSDGQNITSDDFLTSIKFSVAQSFNSSTNIYQALHPGGNNFSSSLVKRFGIENLQTLDLIQFMDSLPESTVNKLLANLNSSENAQNAKNETENSYSLKNEIQDYRTVTKEQLKYPINIAV
ncbi:MAG: hypothetical protein KHX03_01485 [Clostridium sp.]|nr:hypothetical protein [Clostridium sp.]